MFKYFFLFKKKIIKVKKKNLINNQKIIYKFINLFFNYFFFVNPCYYNYDLKLKKNYLMHYYYY